MIWDIITGFLPDIWGYVAAGAAALIAVAVAYIKGGSAAKAKRAVKDAKAHQKTIEEVLHETPSDDPADDIRQRMSDRARKP
jgi:hypothetical protein